MTATTQLPKFPGHHYDAQVSEIGEDGDWVGHGHLPPRRFIAACNRTNREQHGGRTLLEQSDDTYLDLLGSVRHAWAIRLPKCDCPEAVVLEIGCELKHDTDPDPEMWWIDWAGVTKDTPGAFPVTLGLWS